MAALESAVHRLDPVAQQILKTNDEGKTKAARARLVDHFEKINRAAVFLQWARLDVAGRC